MLHHSPPLTEELKHQCLIIIDDLSSHPIAEIFLNPVDPEADGVPNYLSIIKTPSDLGTVKEKLSENMYANLDEFKKDVNLIWENAVLFNGRPSLITSMADRLSRIFQKKMVALEERPHDIWISEYIKNQKSLTKLFRDQPKALEEFNLSPEMEVLVPDRRLVKSALTHEDAKCFANAFKFMDDPVQLGKLMDILMNNEQNIDFSEEELRINMSALSQKTVKLLKSWVGDNKSLKRSESSIV